MIAVVQRVNNASVSSGPEKESVNKGLTVLLGVEKKDGEKDEDYTVKKIINLRIFDDGAGKMNLSVKDIKGEILIISQFTLCASTKKGNRPSFDNAAPPEKALPVFNSVVKKLKLSGLKVKTGFFGETMTVQITNHGPITICLSS